MTWARNDFKTVIIMTDTADHFPITCAFVLRRSLNSENHHENLYKLIVVKVQRQQQRLRETTWGSVKGLDNLNESCKQFTEPLHIIMTVSKI